MTWVSWRQFRTQATTATIGLAALAVLITITGVHLAHVYNATVRPCRTSVGGCGTATMQFLQTYKFLQVALPFLLLVTPALIGIFWGAPLVARELEAGTHRLAWSQSVTRSNWLLVKLAVVGLGSAAVTGLAVLLVAWWTSPIARLSGNRFMPNDFGENGFVPVAYAVFAFALGVVCGLLIRRTLPAMAATLVGFIGVRIATTFWVRPHLMTPLHKTVAILAANGWGFGPDPSGHGIRFFAQAPDIANAWVYSASVVDQAGHSITSQFIQQACPAIAAPVTSNLPGQHVARSASPSAFRDCVARIASVYHLNTVYQPAGRFWIFQTLESAVFLGFALALCGVAVWWVRKAS